MRVGTAEVGIKVGSSAVGIEVEIAGMDADPAAVSFHQYIAHQQQS
jgi:hypothetical protein